MATYQIMTTPVEESALGVVVDTINAEIDARNVTALNADPKATTEVHVTKTSYLSARVAEVLKSYALSHQDSLLTSCLKAYAAASSLKRQGVLTMLGLGSLSSLPVGDQVTVLQGLAADRFKALTIDQQSSLFTTLGV